MRRTAITRVRALRATVANSAWLKAAPEPAVVLFSFLLHFVWEFIQVPAFEGMPQAGHWEGILLCLGATVGDVGLALLAYWAASFAAGSRIWILKPTPWPSTVFIAAGLGLTILLEYYNTEVAARWSYSEMMPLVPWLGTGLTPLLQWAFIPPVVVWLARRHIAGVREIERLRRGGR
jgi:hypothetical protein